MVTNSNNLIKREVDRLFAGLNAKRGECCINPITSGGFVWGIDPIATQKKEAIAALLAREWFAVNGPPDAPPLPLYDVDSYRDARGLKGSLDSTPGRSQDKATAGDVTMFATTPRSTTSLAD